MNFFQNTCKPNGFGGKVMVTMMNSVHSKLADWGFSHLSVKTDWNILDIGCGGGANVAKWLKECEKGYVTGFDYSEISIAKTKKLNKVAVEQSRCMVIKGNVLDMPFENEKYDCISAFETVYFWPGLKDSFGEVFRVLKKDGLFMICNEVDGKNQADEKWTKCIEGMIIYNASQLKNILEKVGFSKIYIDENNKHWLCIVARK